MNKAKLKSYAPQARKDFIAAVTARAHRLGLAENNGQLQIAPAGKSGDLVIIAGQSWPAKISRQRDNLISLIQKHGFAQTMENVAYTWFNRFAALRYMEIHDYLTHGYRVLSNRAGGLPEILGNAPELAQNGDLPGLNPERAIELKLAGDQDGEFYRLTLIAQCNALSNAMPFLFERIDDETELLLPDNLLLTDSVVASLVDTIPEEDWSQVEIIGWLYQFYISEKKDQVIGKVVKSEDIPAATQLFTPNWIVQYLVQNSIGRLWLMANPASTLKNDCPYYIEPAAQTPEVQAQLDSLIQSRMAEDGGSLNPETITVLDPACGSGHILVEAYEVLKAIYLERGYQSRSIPRLILENNLYGLDIDDRAAQLAGFALLMKARADDRRLLDNPPKLNVLALQESKGLDVDQLAQALSGYAALTRPTIASLLDTFANAKTFGSLIQIPSDLNMELASIDDDLKLAIRNGDLLAQETALNLLPLVRQARILGMQFDAVVANPPYMGAKYYDSSLKRLVNTNYEFAKGDLYTCFMVRNTVFANTGGIVGMITISNWMFLSTFEEFRGWLFAQAAIETFLHNGRGVFGSDFGSCAFTFRHQAIPDYKGSYNRLYEKQGSVASNEELEERFLTSKPFESSTADFNKIPGSPVAYWANYIALNHFLNSKLLGEISDLRSGISTGDNDKFYRGWFEVSLHKTNFSPENSNAGKWFPIVRGGDFRRWYGNRESVINLENDGADIICSGNNYRLRNKEFYTKKGVTWSRITLGLLSFRLKTEDVNFGENSPCLFSHGNEKLLLSILNSKVASYFLSLISPTLSNQVVDISKIPIIQFSEINVNFVNQLIEIYKEDWDSTEFSWEFVRLPIIELHNKNTSLGVSWLCWKDYTESKINSAKTLEMENNHILIKAYGLQDELSPEVPESQITLTRADREKDCQRLISYAIGCMMGRYSLDESGLIYAHAGNVDFDPTHYNSFPADADGIVPITDEFWFEDDAANRIREFLLAVWGAETLNENLAWLAESLGQRANETPQETIRRYLAGSFFKDHLQTYKKRPIYWLFSSGKQGAFQALVDLHRYHEGTLAPHARRIRRAADRQNPDAHRNAGKDAAAAPSNAARNKLSKDIEKLK
ncbi:MAG: BREX-1 system adenine-specific DNA-methyltransferase PglX, partial [Methylobacter sp.]